MSGGRATAAVRLKGNPASREALARLSVLLRAAGETRCADAADRALAGSAESLEAFLVSNDLWGGAGSIADQAGLGTSNRSAIDDALVALGRQQILDGHVNARTGFWVEALTRSR